MTEIYLFFFNHCVIFERSIVKGGFNLISNYSTQSIWQIRPFFPQSKWNMGEIFHFDRRNNGRICHISTLCQRVESRPFGFFLVLWSTSAQQFDGSLISRHIFQPIIAPLSSVEWNSVLSLVEIYAKGQNLCCMS